MSQAAFAVRLMNQSDEAPVTLARAGAALSQREQMTMCFDSQIYGVYSALPAATRQSMAEICLERAEEILRMAPTRSVAHLAAAVSRWRLGASDTAIDALQRAQDTARFEGWLSSRRLQFALEMAFDDGATPEAQDAILAIAASEFETLLSSGPLTDDLVEIYQSQPRAREWFIQTLETLPAQQQQRFIVRLRAAG
ncbi:hypothetical protein [Roseinatronobacter sp. NSM]|uniref:hypothetical protein n=1 Tax=Roseinatronobacter sp. NSM TaxID=3457785 RepID=UPI004036A483